MLIKSKISLFLLILALWCSCSDRDRFVEYKNIKGSILFKGQSVDILIRGESGFDDCEMILLYNTNSKLSLQVLPLMVQITTPNGAIWQDTISIDLSNELKAVNKQYGELTIASGCDFTENGVYKLKVKNVSKEVIPGVEELGIALK